jgi:hypothetical protein
MTEDELVARNLILMTEFDRYVLEHPEFAEQIPSNAQIVLLPEDDPELSEKNLGISKPQRESGQPVIYVRIEKVLPPLSRLVNPRIEVPATEAG